MTQLKTTPPQQKNSLLLRDLSAAFMQQMFFWGMDAAALGGNIFQKTGFIKTPSTGLKGTSCYSLPLENGQIFLHGACGGWVSETEEPGFIFIRLKERCFLWHDSQPPVPGKWIAEQLSTPDLISDLLFLVPFLNWWINHETWVESNSSANYRESCYRKYKSLPKSKPWLPPGAGLEWIRMLRENPATTPRAKRFAASLVS